MAKKNYLRKKNGRFAGSIGLGKSKTPVGNETPTTHWTERSGSDPWKEMTVEEMFELFDEAAAYEASVAGREPVPFPGKRGLAGWWEKRRVRKVLKRAANRPE